MVVQAPRENDWDPTQRDNLQQSAVKGVPLIAVGIVVLISFILFAIIRLCCCLCRKVRRKPCVQHLGTLWCITCLHREAAFGSWPV